MLTRVLCVGRGVIRDERVLRLFDLVTATVLLVLLCPLMVVTAIAIKLDSTGPVLADIPERVGKGGKPFALYKFRSMIPRAQEILMTDKRLKKLFAQYKRNNYKLKDDPRITRVGVFIRRHSIDEFPQLFNVIIGNMSLVGPRPYYRFELKDQLAKYPDLASEIRKMQTVLPGITGQWQVSGRSEVDFGERIRLDAAYAKKKNILRDIGILLRTPWAVITGKGAY